MGCRRSAPRPLRQLSLHLIARLRPIRADLGKSQITLRELSATAVDPIEDIDNNVERLIRASHLLDVEYFTAA